MIGTKRIVFALALFVCIYNAESLKCHMCIGSLDSDCKNGDPSKFLEQECTSFEARKKLNISADVEYESWCVAFHAKESLDVSEGFTRGCAYLFKDFDVCSYLQNNDIATEDCHSCKGDFCN